MRRDETRERGTHEQKSKDSPPIPNAIPRHPQVLQRRPRPRDAQPLALARIDAREEQLHVRDDVDRKGEARGERGKELDVVCAAKVVANHCCRRCLVRVRQQPASGGSVAGAESSEGGAESSEGGERAAKGAREQRRGRESSFSVSSSSVCDYLGP